MTIQERAERYADGDTQRDGQAQGPNGDRSTGNGTRFQRDGDQRRFGDRGRESDGGGKRIDPELVAPGERCSALAAADKCWISYLFRHNIAEREQSFFQTDEEQRKSNLNWAGAP